MSEPITVDLGAVTAYADAVEQGYTGTREEFGELLANFAKRADEVKQDKEEVKQTKEEVFSKADSFDKHVEEEKNRVTEEFNSNAEQVLQTNKQEIGSAKSEALEEIENLKEDAVTQVDKTKTDGVQEITILTNEKKALLENTGTNQKNLVESEGTKQIQAVENKGTATLATIPEDYTALNTSVNDLNDLMHTKAPAIVEEATSGTEITVNDSADGMRLQGLNVYGKSWQVTTTGSNLFKITKTSETLKGITFDVRKDGTIKVSGTNTESTALYVILGTFEVVAGQTYIFNNFYSLENSDVETYVQIKNDIMLSNINAVKKDRYMYTPKENGVLNVSFKVRAGVTIDTTLSEMQINVGETVLPYEPYTGGKPSPSPDYPQEIQSAGYVLSTGKNLLNADEYYSEFKQPDGTYKGKVVNINNVRISLSEFVGKKVTLSVKVKVATTTSSVYIAAYIGSEQKRINGSMITSGLTGKSILTITPALNTDYFIISYGSGNDDVTFSELQLELGSVATSYEPYTGGVPALYQKDIEVGVTGKNLFDINSLKFGYAVNTDTGAIASSSISCISEYMQVDSDEKYILSGAPRTLYKIVAFYDENKKYLGRTSGGDFDSIKLEFDNYKDVKYIILSIYENINVQGKIADVKKSNIQIEKGSEATTYEPYKQPQSLQITTPTGLPAIPVQSNTSGITYTDADGQAWIADEIDFERGKYIQRVWQAEFDGSEDEKWRLYNTVVGVEGFSIQAFPENMSGRTGYSNQYTVYKTGDSSKGEGAWFGSSNRYIYLYKNRFFDVSLADKGLSNFKAHLAKHPLKVMTYLDNPIETDLSEEQIQAYKAVHSNKPTTIISNDAYAWMGASYAADTKLYIDNKVQEIASAVIASASEAE
jgi:archaellum component FlaD/FlaE